MHIHLLAVGTRMPGWVDEAYRDYAQRLPSSCDLRLTEIAPARRTRGVDAHRAKIREGDQMLAALPRDARAVALDIGGTPWDSLALADALRRWTRDARDVALLIGGPDGLDSRVLHQCQERWSLSALTLPHALVRVVVAEQIYRAWSVLNNHPYHR